MTREQWRRVESADELRPGMCVELRNCVWCGKRERHILLKKVPSPTGCAVSVNGERLTVAYVWRRAGGCREIEAGAYDLAIRAGRLFILVDANDDATTTEAGARGNRQVHRICAGERWGSVK